MQRSLTYLPYTDTGYFSQLVTDYLSGSDNLAPFINYTPDTEGIRQAVEHRNKYAIDRGNLVRTLTRQYANTNQHDAVKKNIGLLGDDSTFTVCTAHQPNLLTGYLYFIYKIVHAIKLAAELKTKFPGKNFVPVYYMGSEDNDLEELGVFNYHDKKWRWDAAGQTGAIGRMATESLKPLLINLFKVLGPPGEHCNALKELLTKAYLDHKTMGAATRYLVNEFFGKYGLVVLDPDDAAFKSQIIDIIKDDLTNHTAYSLVTAQIEKLSEHYKAQAHPRPVNLFYLHGDIRERIEKKGVTWMVVNTTIEWTEKELLNEIDAHPERFSPNVILRGLLQEKILPNVAFIGGGAEVAYWLQLKPVFQHYSVFYPAILLRQSVLWLQRQQTEQRERAGLTVEEIFKPEAVLVRGYITKHSGNDWQTGEEMIAMEKIMEQLRQKATLLDVTLRSSAEAALTKIKYQLQVLEKKMLRAEKKKMHIELARIAHFKETVFPNNSLQERTENFLDYYLQYGHSFFDTLYDAIQPFKSEFLVVEEK